MPQGKPKLTVKQAKLVKGIAKGKTQRQAYIDAYDTKGHLSTVDAEASKTTNKPQVKEALEKLFGLEETKQIVQNVHKLAVSADDQKVQLEASKEWLNRVLPKQTEGNTQNIVQIINEQQIKYGL